jgi:thiamine pyrophosphokinase
VHALIFLWQPDSSPVHGLPQHDLVVAADSGLDTAFRWGVHVDVAVGDFDSAIPATVERAEANGTEIRRVAAEKDSTDAELAIEVARERGATELTFVMSSLGRPDHAITIMLALGSSNLADCAVRAWIDETYAEVTRSSAALHAKHGRLVSLIPLLGDVAGVTTDQLAYPLHGATLHVGSGRPVSNEFVSDAEMASVTVERGALLVMQSTLFR